MSDDAGGAGGPGLPQNLTVTAVGLTKLTPEEAERGKQAVKKVFDVFDLDKDGYIVGTEIETVLRKLSDDSTNDIVLTEEQIKKAADEAITDVDANADSKVSFDELFSAVLKEAGYEI